jgi:hypothetical protein
VAAERITQPPVSIEIDEKWLWEWVAFGFREMRAYLQKQAAFDEYLIRHDLKEPNVPDA